MLWLFTLPAFAENTILIIGDSISAAYGLNIDQGWVMLLKQRLQEKNYNYRVINASISGDTTSNGLARLPVALKQYQPVITIIELGGNDGLRGLSLDIIQKNLQQMIMLAKTAGSKVILLGVRLPPNYGPAYTQQFQQLYLTLAEKNKINVVPVFLRGVDENAALMQTDGIHPTATAQAMLLDNMWPVLRNMIR